jgi:hypothetical protein
MTRQIQRSKLSHHFGDSCHNTYRIDEGGGHIGALCPNLTSTRANIVAGRAQAEPRRKNSDNRLYTKAPHATQNSTLHTTASRDST